MKFAKVIAVAALALCSLSSFAGGNKVFLDRYSPPGCLNPEGSCENPYNERFNAAWAKGDLETAKTNCRNIDWDDVPALPMPVAVEFCAKSGDVRSIGKYAIWMTDNEGNGANSWRWAEKGAILIREGVPHPDSYPAWSIGCSIAIVNHNVSDALYYCRYSAMSGREKQIENYGVAQSWYQKLPTQEELYEERIREQVMENTRRGWGH